MELLRKRPFWEQHSFSGRIHSTAGSTDSVDIMLEYSRIKGTRIRGVVVGDNDTARSIEALTNSKDRLCRIESLSGDQRSITADGVLFSVVQRSFGGLHKPSGPTKIVARFDCQSVKHSRSFEASDRGRSMTFLLDGPTGVWFPDEMPTLHWDGRREVRTQDTVLDLGIPWLQSVELRPHYFWEHHTDDTPNTYTSVAALIISDSEPFRISGDDFIEKCLALADDITLLLSFITRGRVVWYQHFYSDRDRWIEHRIHSVRTFRKRQGVEDSPVGSAQRAFLKIAYANLRALREDRCDLKLPIMYGIPAGDSQFTEERFASIFWALEKLVDIFAIREDREKVFNHNRFRKFKRVLKTALQTTKCGDSNWGSCSDGINALEDKLPDLNRPPFAMMLTWLCDFLKVEWRDLYPPDFTENKPRFINVRNNLFHSSAPIDGQAVWRETERTRAIFERLVLRALGWIDLDYTFPRGYAEPLDEVL